MYIKAWCPKCNWVGVVGVKKGITTKDCKCPECGHRCRKQSYRGTRDMSSREAHLKTKRGKHEGLDN